MIKNEITSMTDRLYVDNKIYITHYTKTIKKLEEESKIECIVVDNTDFITWYIIKILKKETPELKEELKKIIKEKEY